jgi:hypothetical protein
LLGLLGSASSEATLLPSVTAARSLAFNNKNRHTNVNKPPHRAFGIVQHTPGAFPKAPRLLCSRGSPRRCRLTLVLELVPSVRPRAEAAALSSIDSAPDAGCGDGARGTFGGRFDLNTTAAGAVAN